MYFVCGVILKIMNFCDVVKTGKINKLQKIRVELTLVDPAGKNQPSLHSKFYDITFIYYLFSDFGEDY